LLTKKFNYRLTVISQLLSNEVSQFSRHSFCVSSINCISSDICGRGLTADPRL